MAPLAAIVHLEIAHLEDGGALIVKMAVANEQWLRTLLLRLGPYAEVQEPEQWGDLGAVAARELLACYEAGDS